MTAICRHIFPILADSITPFGVLEPLVMLLLLAGSAFFSGTETAFFNLSRRQINGFRDSTHKVQKLAAVILHKPKELLGCLLFGNMTVNVLFFAVSSVMTVRLQRQFGLVAAAITAGVSFCVLVLFGEILPKSLAYSNSKKISVATAVPIFVCMQVFRPLLFAFRIVLVEPVIRLLLGPVRADEPVTTAEFKSLIEQTGKRGLISADENRLLTEIVEFGFLKVRHVMWPRVDMIACSVTDSPQAARELMIKSNLTKLPVFVGSIDKVVGMVTLRQLLLDEGKSLDKLVGKVHFVPEQKTVESLLEFFRREKIDTAVVVDEYGGIAGSVRLEDIAEELLGPIEPTEDITPIEQTGPFEYRLAGDLAIHDWADAFNMKPQESRVSTIGGLVTAMLGKIPKSGDVAHLKNLKFTVEHVRKRRIETVILTLESMGTDDQ